MATSADHRSTLLLAIATLVGVLLAVAGLNGFLDPIMELLALYAETPVTLLGG